MSADLTPEFLAKLDPISLAVPFFILLIFVEALTAWLSRRQRERRLYRWNDTISALSTGLIFSIAGVAVTAGALYIYAVVGAALPLGDAMLRAMGLPAINLGSPWYVWFIVLIVVDFVYYWFHRACHEVRFLWACHVTHHSGEEFNLSTALRQCASQRIFEYAFYLPLAVAGVPWQMMFICHSGVKIYQFWVHTRVIGKLGIFEAFMLTPSHHRVHHGRDPRYLDKNHGGIFILWDRWFGTYVEETDEPHYGLTKPLANWDPLWANVHEYAGIWNDARRTRRWRDKIGVFLNKPGWRPDDLGGPLPVPEVGASYRKYDPSLSPGETAYAFVQFVILTVAALLFLKAAKGTATSAALLALSPLLLAGWATYVVIALASVGAFLNYGQSRRSTLFEALRLGFVAVAMPVLAFVYDWPAATAGGIAAVALGSIVWLMLLRRSSFDAEPAALHRG